MKNYFLAMFSLTLKFQMIFDHYLCAFTFYLKYYNKFCNINSADLCFLLILFCDIWVEQH